MKNLFIVAVVVIGLAGLGGCASSNSGSAYSRSQARTEQTVRLGVVEHVRDVQIEGTKSGAGGAAGGVVGGVAGSNIGKGKGAVIGTVVGVVAGAVVGDRAEEAVTKKQGLEVTVKLDSGSMVAIVQEADELFGVGDRVRVLSGQGVSRVTH